MHYCYKGNYLYISKDFIYYTISFYFLTVTTLTNQSFYTEVCIVFKISSKIRGPKSRLQSLIENANQKYMYGNSHVTFRSLRHPHTYFSIRLAFVDGDCHLARFPGIQS